MATMAKALRKTIRKKHSCCSRVFGCIVTVFGLLLIISKGMVFDFGNIITLAAVNIILIVLLLEDRLNGYVAKKRLLPGTEKAVAVFCENGFSSTTDIGKTEWNYDKIMMIVEIDNSFVFIYNQNHAQLYDKQHLQGGTVDDFRCFIENITGKQIQKI